VEVSAAAEGPAIAGGNVADPVLKPCGAITASEGETKLFSLRHPFWRFQTLNIHMGLLKWAARQMILKHAARTLSDE
jgi:hypothetical protein